MRIAPTTIDYSTIAITNAIALNTAITVIVVSQASALTVSLFATGSSVLVANYPYFLANNNSTSAYIGFSAEL